MQYVGQIHDEFRNIFDRAICNISSLGDRIRVEIRWRCSMRIMHVDLKNKYAYSMFLSPGSWSEGKYLFTKKPARGT